MQVFLETDRLTLRRFTEDDLDDLCALDSDPEVMRFLSGGAPTPREKIQHEMLPKIFRHYALPGGLSYWAAVERASGEFLGWFALTPPKGWRRDGVSPGMPSAPDDAELGYRLRRSAWGKGYATEGSRALVDMGFAELRLRRVHAQTMAVNTRSRRVMEKAGLRHVRTFHKVWDDPIDGTEHGEVEYALTWAEWQRPGRASYASASRRRPQ